MIAITCVIAVGLLFPTVASAAGGDIYTFDPVAKPGTTPTILSINPTDGSQTVVSSGGLFDRLVGLWFWPTVKTTTSSASIERRAGKPS
jgi:hypothetical protein